MLILTGLLLLIVLTGLTGFFVAQEFAYITADRSRLRLLAERDDRAAGLALRVGDRLSFTLSGAQVGITVTGLLAGYLAEPTLGRGLAEALAATGLPPRAGTPVAVGIAVFAATGVQMLLGELVPKNLAVARPEALARVLAAPTLGLLAATGWLIRVFDVAATRLLLVAGVRPVERLAQGATSEDLDRIIARSHAGGMLDADTYRLLAHGLGFRRLTAGTVMVPRVDVVSVPATAPATRVIELLPTGHTRFPVTGASIDDIVGVVAVADVVGVDPDRRDGVPVGSLAAAPVLVATTTPLPQALELLRARHQQLACVVDEYGGLAGVVTLEDIAEELVGAILDEDDLPEPGAVALPDGSWLVPGRWRPDEVAEATGVRLPRPPGLATVSGLVMAHLGRVPAVGDSVELPLPARFDARGEPVAAGSVCAEVTRVARHVPLLVRLRTCPEATADARADARTAVAGTGGAVAGTGGEVAP